MMGPLVRMCQNKYLPSIVENANWSSWFGHYFLEAIIDLSNQKAKQGELAWPYDEIIRNQYL